MRSSHRLYFWQIEMLYEKNLADLPFFSLNIYEDLK